MYLVIDAETNLKNRGESAVGGFEANPFHPENKAVYWGWKLAKLSVGVQRIPVFDLTGIISRSKVTLLIGHNIKFDLHYLWKYERNKAVMYEEKIQIWDTQLAEYLLTGQHTKWASLDILSVKYGGTLKDEKIKEYWDAGIDTEDIPEEEITPYVEQDVVNTELIFLAQLTQAHKMGMLPLIMSQMEGLLATTEIEWNGIHFDKALAHKKTIEMSVEATKCEDTLNFLLSASGIVSPNPSSNKHVALWLFGGDQTYKEAVGVIDDEGEPILYKTGVKKGEQKTKITIISKKIERKVVPKKEWENKTGYSVDEEVVEELLKPSKVPITGLPTPSNILVFLRTLQDYRRLTKDVKTYYIGFSKLTWPDGIIHGHFNHCATHTGRLSSTSPNLQNVTRNEEKT